MFDEQFYKLIKRFLLSDCEDYTMHQNLLSAAAQQINKDNDKKFKVKVYNFKGSSQNKGGFINQEQPEIIHLNGKAHGSNEELLFTFLHESRHSEQHFLYDTNKINSEHMKFNMEHVFDYEPIYASCPIERDANFFALKRLRDIISYFKEHDKDIDVSRLENVYLAKKNEIDRKIISSVHTLCKNKYIRHNLPRNYSIVNDETIADCEKYKTFLEHGELLEKEACNHDVYVPLHKLKQYGDINSSYKLNIGDKRRILYVQHAEDGILVKLVNAKTIVETSCCITDDKCFINNTRPCLFLDYPGGIVSMDEDNAKEGKLSAKILFEEMNAVKKLLPYIIKIDGRYNPENIQFYTDKHHFFVNKHMYNTIAFMNDFKIIDENRENKTMQQQEQENKILNVLKERFKDREVIENGEYFLRSDIIDVEMQKAAFKTGNALDAKNLSPQEVLTEDKRKIVEMEL